MLVAIIVIISFLSIFFSITGAVYDSKENKKKREMALLDQKRLEISLKGPYGKELSKLLAKKAQLEAEKTKAVDSMAAVTNATASLQQKEKDWAVHGGIASGIGGPVIGGITAMNTIAENQQIRANNEMIRQSFQPAFSSASQSYGRILVQIDEIDKKIAEIRKKDRFRVLEVIESEKDKIIKEEERKKEEAARKRAEEEAYKKTPEYIEAQRIKNEEKRKKDRKTALIVIPILVIFIVGLAILLTIIIPNSNYKKAMELIDSGQFNEAGHILYNYRNIKDCEEILRTLIKENPQFFEDETKILVFCSEVGDTVKSGYFEQDGKESNGKEDIEWIVIAKEDGRALLLSKYILDYHNYGQGWACEWSDSSAKKWLDEEFRGDNVFLLDFDELTKYMPDQKDRITTGTTYAERHSIHDPEIWLLRFEQNSRQTNIVLSDGRISTYYRNTEVFGIRPAKWVYY